MLGTNMPERRHQATAMSERWFSVRFFLRWLVASIAVAAAVLIIPGISVTGENTVLAIIIGAGLLGLLNASLGLVLKVGTIGCIVMTLGLFTLVINAAMLMLTSWVSQNWFSLGFHVDGFWPAFWGAIVISIVSGLLNSFVRDDDD